MTDGAVGTRPGLGDVALDIRFVRPGPLTHSFGFHGISYLNMSLDGVNGPVAWWGTVPEAMVPTFAYVHRVVHEEGVRAGQGLDRVGGVVTRGVPGGSRGVRARAPGRAVVTGGV